MFARRCKVEPRLEATAPVLLPVSAGVKSLSLQNRPQATIHVFFFRRQGRTSRWEQRTPFAMPSPTTAVPVPDRPEFTGDPWSDPWQARNNDPVKVRRPAWEVVQPISWGPSPAAAWATDWLETNCDPLNAESLRPAWDQSDRGNKIHVFCDPRLIPQASASAAP